MQQAQAAAAARDPILVTCARTVIFVFLIVLGTLVLPQARESFRLPKDLAFRAEAILLLGCWALLFVSGWKPKRSGADKPVLVLTSLALLWTLITTVASVNRALSFAAFATACATACTMLSVYFFVGSRRKITDLAWLSVAALTNAVVVILQALRVWSPVRLDPTVPMMMRVTALIGNPNDVGSYLIAPLLCSVAVAVTSKRWRWIATLCALIFLQGIVAAHATTAMIACAAGLSCIAIAASNHPRRVTAGVVAAAIVFSAIVIGAGRVTMDDVRRLQRIDELNNALSFRVPPFISAWRMFVDHPVFGVGPGCFGFCYFDYKIAVEHDHPLLFHSGEGWSSFAQVHNDHLEVLAETGAPGYVLFLVILAFLASQSFRIDEQRLRDPEMRRLVRLTAFPVSIALTVLCLAQFPLQLASATSSFGYVFALVLGWCRR